MMQIIKGLLASGFRRLFGNHVSPIVFVGSEDYWNRRYALGGTSGPGSYGVLAEFKARVLNELVRDENIRSVIEFGCGDGNQLLLAKYPQYTGFDISERAVSVCRSRFKYDNSKSFKLLSEYSGETAELALSLDVIYHLVEDEVFEMHMGRCFVSATRYVVVYSTNTEQQMSKQAHHVRHRRFTDWIVTNCHGWVLAKHVENLHAYKGDLAVGSSADFFIYRKSQGVSGLM